jgi:hypothetical protein
MRWSPWYSRYEAMTLLVMLMRCIAALLVALGYIYMLVNGLLCKNAIRSSLVTRMPLEFKLGAYGYILVNLCMEPCFVYLGSNIRLSSWMFSLHATLWSSLSFFCRKGTSCTILTCKSWIWYVGCLCLKNMFSYHKCFKFLILCAQPLHDVHEWDVSCLEVDTWLGGFSMTWDSL